MKIYISNISSEVTEEDLRRAFEFFGKVDSVSVVCDESTGKSTDCAFVEMPSDLEALAALSSLSNSELNGNRIQVNSARTGLTDRRRPGRGGGKRKNDPKPRG